MTPAWEVVLQEFAVAFAEAFEGSADRPVQAWIDRLGDHGYVRVVFRGRVSKDSRARLRFVRDYLGDMTGARWTVVAYPNVQGFGMFEPLALVFKRRGYGGVP